VRIADRLRAVATRMSRSRPAQMPRLGCRHSPGDRGVERGYVLQAMASGERRFSRAAPPTPRCAEILTFAGSPARGSGRARAERQSPGSSVSTRATCQASRSGGRRPCPDARRLCRSRWSRIRRSDETAVTGGLAAPPLLLYRVPAAAIGDRRGGAVQSEPRQHRVGETGALTRASRPLGSRRSMKSRRLEYGMAVIYGKSPPAAGERRDVV
jgi:hypothetical protein